MNELAIRGVALPERPVCIDGFLAGLLSDRTKKAYIRDLRDFFTVMGIREPWGVTSDQVIEYRNRIMRFDRDNAELLNPASVSRRLSAIRSFFDYARARGAVDRNPADAKLVKSPKVSSEGKTKGLSNGEMRSLLEQPDRTALRGKRDYAILSLLANGGLRRSEAAGLKVRHFGEERGHRVIRFRGKGNKERTLPIKPETWQAIEDYRQASGRDFSDPETPIFSPTMNNRGKALNKPLTGTSIRNMVDKYAGEAGIRGISPHSFRVFAVTNALENGATYQQVQMMTGHSDPKTVARYDRGKNNLDRNAVYWVRF